MLQPTSLILITIEFYIIVFVVDITQSKDVLWMPTRNTLIWYLMSHLSFGSERIKFLIDLCFRQQHYF